MSKASKKGVFCLECDWDTDLRSTKTVQPALDLLSISAAPEISTIRRDIGTKVEFEFYISKWAQKRYRDFPLLYLAFHGQTESIFFGSGKEEITFDELEEQLVGKCANRIIHFGSCGTIGIHGKRLTRFLKNTRALAVCGYRNNVDWLLSTAFEIVLFSAFQDNALTRSGMRAVQKRILREVGGLSKDLGFRFEISKS